MELLAGAPNDSAAADLEKLVDGLPSLPLEPALDFRTAAQIYRSARQVGLTLRILNDCLIAALALRHRVTVVHQDIDFEVIATMPRLEQIAIR